MEVFLLNHSCTDWVGRSAVQCIHHVHHRCRRSSRVIRRWFSAVQNYEMVLWVFGPLGYVDVEQRRHEQQSSKLGQRYEYQIHSYWSGFWRRRTGDNRNNIVHCDFFDSPSVYGGIIVESALHWMKGTAAGWLNDWPLQVSNGWMKLWRIRRDYLFTWPHKDPPKITNVRRTKVYFWGRLNKS